MGSYTALEVKATLNEAGMAIVPQLCKSNWDDIKDLPAFAFPWLGVYRRNFIPHGGQCLGGWPDTFSHISADGKTWHFVCSLKNYEGEIELFFDKILPHMITALEVCRTQFEYGDEDKWVLVDGKIVRAEQ